MLVKASLKMPTTIINGTSAAETLFGTNTRDVSVTYDEIFYGNGGADIIYAGGGNDWVWASAGDPSNVTFFGWDGDDVLVSFEGADWLDGQAGNDILISGAGNDALLGGDGDDQLWAGEGSDQINGGSGADWLIGGDGNDFLVGGLGDETRDILIGGSGADEYSTDGVRSFEPRQVSTFSFADAETVDWAWGFSIAEGDTIKFAPEEMASADSVGTALLTIDGVSGTMVYASSETHTLRPGISVIDFDSALFLPGVQITAEQLIDSGALLFG
jgi:Ca2+-binding RTX toxin-like protein